jgi:tricarballylate dehydrogenase
VTTGITFTFGGLKITTDAEVEDNSGHPIPGLYAAGTGLMSGAVFGGIAGRSAATRTKRRQDSNPLVGASLFP